MVLSPSKKKESHTCNHQISPLLEGDHSTAHLSHNCAESTHNCVYFHQRGRKKLRGAALNSGFKYELPV